MHAQPESWTTSTLSRLKGKWRDGTLPAVVFSLSLLVALRAPGYADSGLLRAVAELDLIVLGVLIGLLFTEDPSKTYAALDLEIRRAPGVVSAMGFNDVAKLIEDILRIRSSTDMAKLATDHGWRPILDAASQPTGAIRWDHTYDIELSGPEVLEGWEVYRVNTRSHVLRRLPGSDVWLTFLRTQAAARREYAEPRAVFREVVDVPTDLWKLLIERDLLQGSIVINNKEYKAIDWQQPTDDVLRLLFQVPAVDEPVRVTSLFSYYSSASVRYFSARFVRYFCVGSSAVRCRIIDPDVTSLEALVFFAGDVLLDPTEEGIIQRHTGSKNTLEAEVRTSSSVVLWPGSGVVFAWRRDDE